MPNGRADAWKAKRTGYAAGMNWSFRTIRPPVWTRILAAACLLLAGFDTARSADEQESTLTKVGQAAPALTVTALDGKPFDTDYVRWLRSR